MIMWDGDCGCALFIVIINADGVGVVYSEGVSVIYIILS